MSAQRGRDGSPSRPFSRCGPLGEWALLVAQISEPAEVSTVHQAFADKNVGDTAGRNACATLVGAAPYRLVRVRILRELISTLPHVCVHLCSSVVFFCMVAVVAADGQTNSTNQPSPGARAEQIRTACVEGRRYVCGKVLQVTPEGLVVDSGYPDLLNPPFNKSWVVRSTASINRPSHLIEQRSPDAICVGLVFLTGIPKKPEVHEYDYVVLHAYPAGECQYKPVPGVEKTVRRFSASLELAVKLNLQN